MICPYNSIVIKCRATHRAARGRLLPDPGSAREAAPHKA